MTFEVVGGSGEIVTEPDWTSFFDDDLDLQAVRAHWRQVVAECRDAQTLAAVNGHMIQRLAVSRVIYDRALRVVAERGAVMKPRQRSKTAIARVSPYWTVLREAGADCDRLEQELALSPRRRAAGGKVEKPKGRGKASDAYLKPVAK